MNPYQKVIIGHIVSSLEKAREYVEGISYDEFILNEEKQDAVIRKMEIAGEACKQVREEIRLKHPEIPWKAMAGMRDG